MTKNYESRGINGHLNCIMKGRHEIYCIKSYSQETPFHLAGQVRFASLAVKHGWKGHAIKYWEAYGYDSVDRLWEPRPWSLILAQLYREFGGHRLFPALRRTNELERLDDLALAVLMSLLRLLRWVRRRVNAPSLTSEHPTNLSIYLPTYPPTYLLSLILWHPRLSDSNRIGRVPKG